MKFLLYAITFAALTLTVPWFFSSNQAHNGTAPPDLPVWVIYAIVAAVFYAVLVAVCMRFFWDESARDSEPVDQSTSEDPFH